MTNMFEVRETNKMIEKENLDVRTITMGISLMDCIDGSADKACDKIYDKITKKAENLVKTGEDIEREFGIPIVNKRISVTPIAMLAGANPASSPVHYARALDRAAKTVGVNFIVEAIVCTIVGAAVAKAVDRYVNRASTSTRSIVEAGEETVEEVAEEAAEVAEAE